jgi:hypothetical protein
MGVYGYCDGETQIVRGGVTYRPWQIKASNFTFTGTQDKSDVIVTMARGSGLEDEFMGFPPEGVVNIVIYEGHYTPGFLPGDFSVIWRGRIVNHEFPDELSEVAFTCMPVSSVIMMPGLRRNYQLSCPHALYGPHCLANKATATVNRTVTALSGYQVVLSSALGWPLDFRNGIATWTYNTTRTGTRTVIAVSENGMVLTLRGTLRGLSVGSVLSISKGCNRSEENCTRIHNNIHNYGGQPFIPLENPFSQKNQFY